MSIEIDAQKEMEEYVSSIIPNSSMSEQMKKVIANCENVKDKYVSSHYSMEEMSGKIKNLVALFGSVIDFKFREIMDILTSGNIISIDYFEELLREQENIMQEFNDMRVKLKTQFNISTIVKETTEEMLKEARRTLDTYNNESNTQDMSRLPSDFVTLIDNQLYRIQRRDKSGEVNEV